MSLNIKKIAGSLYIQNLICLFIAFFLFVSLYYTGINYGLDLAIQGLYAAIGILLVMLIINTYSYSIKLPERILNWSKKSYLKVYTITIFSGLVVVAQIKSVSVLLFLSCLISLLILMSIWRGLSNTYTLSMVLTLFWFQFSFKSLNTGLYFGSNDQLARMSETVHILTTFTTSGISSGYQEFPGLPLVTAIIARVSQTGIGASYGILGLLCTTILLLAIFLLIKAITQDKRVAVFAIFGSVGILHIQFFSTYVFPQSVAFPLLAVVIYFIIRRFRVPSHVSKRLGLTSIMIISGATLIHHMVFVISFPLLISGYFIESIQPQYNLNLIFKKVPKNRILVALFVIIPFSYWTIGNTHFVKTFIFWTLRTLSEGFGRGSTIPEYVYLGQFEINPVVLSVEWLASPFGVNNIVLFSIFFVGVFALRNISKGNIGYWLLSIFSGIFILKTPISIKSFNRLGMVWTIFFVINIGIGLRYRFDGILRKKEINASQIILSVVLILFTATGGITTPGDPFNTNPQETFQSEFNNKELEQLKSASRTLTRNDIIPTTTFNNKLYFEISSEDSYSLPIRGKAGVRTQSDLLLLREGEAGVPQPTSNPGRYSTRFIYSKSWLMDYKSSKNTIYNSGDIHIMQCDDKCILTD